MSSPRELKTEVVVSWRAKEYPPVELPKLFGDPHRRFSQGGEGYEADVTVDACPLHAEAALKSAPKPPTPKSAFSMASVVDKPLRPQEIPNSLAFGKMGLRFTVRLSADCFYPKGKIVRNVDHARALESYLLIEDVRKKAEDTKYVEVSFKVVPKPLSEVAA
jgi:hypothetical protein